MFIVRFHFMIGTDEIKISSVGLSSLKDCESLISSCQERFFFDWGVYDIYFKEDEETYYLVDLGGL